MPGLGSRPEPCLGPLVLLQQGSCGHGLSPETMWRAMICAPADHGEQGGFFSSDIDDCRHGVDREGHGRLL